MLGEHSGPVLKRSRYLVAAYDVAVPGNRDHIFTYAPSSASLHPTAHTASFNSYSYLQFASAAARAV